MPSPLNGYALTNKFRKLRTRQVFTHLEAYLFFELVALCNDEGWPAEFTASNRTLEAALGCSEKAVIKCRETLKKAGLLDYTEGQNRRPTIYRFNSLEPLPEVSLPTPKDLPQVSVSPSKGLPECLPQVRVSTENNDKHLPKGLPEYLPEVSPYIEQTKRERKEEKESAAAAASLPSSLPVENSAITPAASLPTLTAKKPKKAGTVHAEIAALPLPHPGPDFAATWRTFYTENTKQAGKPLSAFELMLKKLGKYPEGFAVEMLEAAIQGNWSGVENGGTAQRYIDWQQRLLTTQPAPSRPAPLPSSDLNHALIAEQEAASAAALTERLNRYATAP